MQGLKELLSKEEHRLKEIKRIVDERLTNVPNGTLRITSSKNKLQYIQCVEDDSDTGYKLTYIKKEDMPLVYYDKMDAQEKRDLVEQLISEINVYEDRTPEGQWIKSVKFKLPLVSEEMTIGLDKGDHVETVVLLTKTTDKEV